MSVLRIERRDRVAILTFDDPDRRNVVSDEMNEELLAAFDDLEADDGIGAVVLTGAGRAFCAGAVLDDLLEAGEGIPKVRSPTSTGGSSVWPTPRCPRSPP